MLCNGPASRPHAESRPVPLLNNPGFSYYELEASGDIPPGTYTITLTGTTLSPQSLSSNVNGFIVTSDSDFCYTNGAATGAIVPPGSAKIANSGQAMLISSLAVLSCLLFFL